MFVLLILNIFIVLTTSQINDLTPRPVANTPLGHIIGTHKKSFNSRTYSAFEGIPFAKPPIGRRRFEKPEPVEKWNVTLDASFLYECPQTRPFTLEKIITGDEDCLYLNIYTPRKYPSPSDNLDVIVHIHGGGFMFGSGHAYAHPRYLMDRDVLFVTFNYRLSILGFLSTEDEVLPGNNGLKDQVMALEWVQKNIASFGGNPNSVTLNGASAGAASVHLHYFSPTSRGLFHRGWSTSGSALNPWALKKGVKEKAKILAHALGCPQQSSKALVNCLKDKDHSEILNQTYLFYEYKWYPVGLFGPVVENISSSHTFLNKHPYVSLVDGQINNLPWIVSFLPHEGGSAFPDFRNDQKTILSLWKNISHVLLLYGDLLPNNKREEVAEKIRNFYLGADPNDSNDVTNKFVKMASDRLFIGGVIKSASLQANATTAPVYLYELSYPGDHKKIVEHADDNQYFFNDQYPRKPTDNELKVKDLMINLMVSFAKTGKPTIEGINWPPVQTNNATYLNISGFKLDEIKLEKNQDVANLNFWNSLGIQENENC